MDKLSWFNLEDYDSISRLTKDELKTFIENRISIYLYLLDLEDQLDSSDIEQEFINLIKGKDYYKNDETDETANLSLLEQIIEERAIPRYSIKNFTFMNSIDLFLEITEKFSYISTAFKKIINLRKKRAKADFRSQMESFNPRISEEIKRITSRFKSTTQNTEYHNNAINFDSGKIIICNLNNSDEQILDDFSIWLKEQRKRELEITETNDSHLISALISQKWIPCLDLLFVSHINRNDKAKKITQAEIGGLLFAGLEETRDRARKTTIPKAKRLLDPKYRDEIFKS